MAYIFKGNFCPAKANILTLDLQDMKQCLCGIDTAELAIITVQTFPTCTPLVIHRSLDFIMFQNGLEWRNRRFIERNIV